MRPSTDEPAVIVQKAYTWNLWDLWVLKKTENFPRSHKFCLGQMLTEGSLRPSCIWWTPVTRSKNQPPFWAQ